MDKADTIKIQGIINIPHVLHMRDVFISNVNFR